MLTISAEQARRIINSRNEEIDIMRNSNVNIKRYHRQMSKLLKLFKQGKKVGSNTGDIDIIASGSEKYNSNDKCVSIVNEKENITVIGLPIEGGTIIGQYEKIKAPSLISVENRYLLLEGTLNILGLSVFNDEGQETAKGDLGVNVEKCSLVDVLESEGKVTDYLNKSRGKITKENLVGIVLKKPKIRLCFKSYSRAAGVNVMAFMEAPVENGYYNQTDFEKMLKNYTDGQKNKINKYMQNISQGKILLRHSLEELNYEEDFNKLIDAKA